MTFLNRDLGKKYLWIFRGDKKKIECIAPFQNPKKLNSPLPTEEIKIDNTEYFVGMETGVCPDPSYSNKLNTYVATNKQIFIFSETEQGEISSSKESYSLDLPKGEEIQQIAAGRNHLIILSSNGKAYALGSNEHGQAIPHKKNSQNKPKKIKEITHIYSVARNQRIIDIVAGEYFTALITENNQMYLFGKWLGGCLDKAHSHKAINLNNFFKKYPSSKTNIHLASPPEIHLGFLFLLVFSILGAVTSLVLGIILFSTINSYLVPVLLITAFTASVILIFVSAKNLQKSSTNLPKNLEQENGNNPVIPARDIYPEQERNLKQTDKTEHPSPSPPPLTKK